MGPEATGFEQRFRDVVREVPESNKRGAAKAFELSVDRLGRSVAGAGAIEEREYDGGTLLQRLTDPADLAVNR